jgi:hypothetical protein
MIIETLVPIDFYTNMLGGLIDSEIFDVLMKARLPVLWEHLTEHGF